MSFAVLIVEDERVLARKLAKYLAQSGFDTRVVHAGIDALELLVEFLPDAVVLDFNLPGQFNGLEILERIKAVDPGIKVIMATGQGNERLAVDAMKAGAFDYLSKPIVLSELKLLLDRAMATRRTEGQLSYFHERQASGSDIDGIVGDSAAVLGMKSQVRRILEAGQRMTTGMPPSVLITGETGTGKELVARALHFGGVRRDQPFIELNAAAIPGHLVESELFGYEKGAFTDARTGKQGLLEAADGGTLFLDEVGELEPAVQAKLLRALEDRKVRRLGSVRDHEVNIQIVTATNRCLRDLAEQGGFREDLFFRLNTLTVEVPALRDRGDDVLVLARHFVSIFARKYAKSGLALTDRACETLLGYLWPGNVRELRNTMEQAVLLTEGDRIGAAQFIFPAHLMKQPAPEAPATGDRPTPVGTLESVERDLIVRTLQQVDGNVSKAARQLGISRDQLRYRIAKYAL